MAGEEVSDKKVLNVGPGVELPLSVVTAKAAILAMTGMGKTYLAKVIAEEMLNHGVQIVVGDYLGVWWGLTSSANGKKEGKNVVVFGGDHADVPINENAGALIADLVVNDRVNAVLDVSGFEDDAPKIRFMTAFAKRLFHKNKRPIHFFLDEADEYVPQSPQREQIACFSILKRIWQRGRVKGIGGTLISQRSAVVNKSLLSQSEMLIALRTVGPQDREALQNWFESWGTAEQIKEFEKTISNLPNFHAWFWSPKHRLFVQGKARKAETFDSSATPEVEGDAIEEPTKRTEHDIARFGKEIERLAEVAATEDPDLLLRQNSKLSKERDHFREQFEIAKKRIEILEVRETKKAKANTIVRDKPVKVPAISPRTMKEITKTRAHLRKTADTVSAAISGAAQTFAEDADRLISRLDAELSKAERMAKPVGGWRDKVNAEAQAFRDRDPVQQEMNRAAADRMYRELDEPAETPVPAVLGRPGGANGNGSGGKVSGGKRRILAALAQHGRMKPGRARVLAGIASLDTWNTYARQLKREGFAQSDGDEIKITKPGLDELGEYEPLPTGRALVEYWHNELGNGGKGSIFRALLAAPTIAFRDDELMKAAKIASLDTLNTYRRQLIVLGLAERIGKTATKIHRDFESL